MKDQGLVRLILSFKPTTFAVLDLSGKGKGHFNVFTSKWLIGVQSRVRRILINITNTIWSSPWGGAQLVLHLARLASLKVVNGY